MVKKEIKNDSDSEDEGKKTRQRFKSERPKQQHKIEKHEPSMLMRTSVLKALTRAVTKILVPGISPDFTISMTQATFIRTKRTFYLFNFLPANCIYPAT